MFNRWFYDKATRSLPQTAPLADLRRAFCRVPLGQRMLKWADEQNVQIAVADLCGKQRSGAFQTWDNSIVINSALSLNECVETLAHELRHAWQYHQKPEVMTTRMANPFAACIITRFLEADAMSFSDFFMADYYARLNKASSQSENKPHYKQDPVSRRRKTFEHFFRPQSAEKYYYDRYNTRLKNMLIGGYTQFPSRLLSFNTVSSNFRLQEEDLTFVGQCAWGECKGRDYLNGDKNSFSLKSSYLNDFPADSLKFLKPLRFHRSQNSIFMKDGTRRSAIRFR